MKSGWNYKQAAGIMAVLLFMLLLAACGGAANDNGNAQPSGETASGEEAAFPRTIEHAKGKTVLETKPENIAVTYFPYADHLFAIGLQDLVGGVVGLKSLQNFPVYDEFTKDGKIADLGDAVELEKLVAMDPDVIIAWEADEEMYDQLEKIAPTIVIPQSENWQDTIEKVAAVAGEEEKAKQYKDEYDRRLEELAAKMKETGEQGKTAIFMMTWGKGFNYYSGVRMEPYYEKLGFKPFEGMSDWGEISLEGVSEVDPDYIFVGEDFTGTAELKLDDLKNNAVWSKLKAVRDGNVHIVDSEIVGPLAMGQSKGLDVLEEIMQ